MRRLIVILSLFALVLPVAVQSAAQSAATQPSQSALAQSTNTPSGKPWFFAVLSDTQFGMYAKNENFTRETANFEYVVSNLNRLHPRFVVICGDLVNRPGDAAQIAEYRRILRKLDPSIPVYSLPGNHDVGNVPTPASLDAYHNSIGSDHYLFTFGNFFGIVLNSNLIRSPEGAPEAAAEQESWLKAELASLQANPKLQIVIFQHIPYFIKNANEPTVYDNIPEPARQKYLQLLKQSNVQYVFAGHFHYPSTVKDGSLTEILTGAVGKPLRGSLSGFRIVTVNDGKFNSSWYCLGGIPDHIDPLKLPSTPCPLESN